MRSAETIAFTTLCVVWLVGVSVYASYAVLSVIGCWRAVRRCQVRVEEPLAALMTKLSQHLNVRKRVRLSVVDGAVGPVTVGWLRPMIVIPLALVQKSVEELEPILAHELIHVRRGDALVGMLQVVFQSVWWFHPLVWLANRNLCFERERCCDEEVVAELGVLELRRQLWLPAAVPGIRPFEVTRRRLAYLDLYSKHFRKRMPRSYWLVLLVGLFLVAPGAGLSRFDKGGSAIASQPAPKKESAEPDGWSVKGRIVDHRGLAVPNAEVLLLGEERIIVDADKRNWFVFGTEKGRSSKPPSTRTNNNGEFSIARSEGGANRIAVISTDPLFWVVAREKFTGIDDVEIKLPPSGSLAIDCDLPGKPAKQPVNIELRTFDGVNWNGDMLRFHFGSFSIKNPGETVFEHLPPGRYSVQRNQETQTAERERLITLADRQLVDVESNKRATVRIHRKIGRPLTGHVRGLENVDLRHARVSINYFGPEEELGKNGRPIRQLTAFDVIPITSKGDFTTDPIPPGEYMVDLFAMRSTTSNQSPQHSDFRGQLRFTVPEGGEIPTVEVVAKPRQDRSGRQAAPDQETMNPLRVLDEQGNPIPRFELKVWTADHGSSTWLIDSDGQIPQNQPLWGFEKAEAVDITVRADGYASTVAHFAGADRERLLRGEATVVMQRGEEVQILFRLPDAMTWPDGLKPDLYFDNLSNDIRTLWQPSNRRAYADTGLPDFNMLNVRADMQGVATLRLGRDTAPFRVAIYSPGFLQFYEWGPFTMADVKNGTLEIKVERPAALDVRFDLDDFPADQLPFDAAAITVLWKIPGVGGSYLSVTDFSGTEIRRQLRLTDLSAGDYRVTVRTKARPDVQNRPNTHEIPVNPGVFSASKNASLKAGKSERIDFRYLPFDEDAFRGDRTAVVRIVRPDGSSAVGRHATISYFDGHYGNLEVFAGSVPKSGAITLTRITGRKTDGTFADPYTVRVDNQQLGRFGFADGSTNQEFAFRVPPAAGDMCPDVSILNLANGMTTTLSSLRGKVVCLEFWATWCGPCREPLQTLNQMATDKRDVWKDQVAIVPLSIDESSDIVVQTIARRGLTRMEPFWSGGKETIGWESPAARAFVVSGVPMLFILDRDGRILWRGHPNDDSDGKGLAGRIEAALRQ